MITDKHSDAELQAYADGQLSARQRYEIEHELGRNPQQAAQMMLALRSRSAVRLLLDDPGDAAPSAKGAAAHLAEALARRRGLPHSARAVAVVALVVAAAGLGAVITQKATQDDPAQPAFVAEATRAHQTALLRASMRSQPVVTVYDPAEIQSATRIALPAFPSAWRIADVQVFPSAHGPTVELTLNTRNLGQASLYAARTTRFAVSAPTLAQSPQGSIATWQMGEIAYAFTAEGSNADLIGTANDLAKSLH